MDIYYNFQNNNKSSRGEICVANFIPPANGASVVKTFSEL
jgi:hypothetical protein